MFLHWSVPAVLPVGLWWVAVSMLHHQHFNISLTVEHQEAWSEDCWAEDEPGCI